MVQHVTSLPLIISDEIRTGTALAGNDFQEDQLQIWFSQEQEAFFSNDAGNSEEDHWYRYMRYTNSRLGIDLLQEFGLAPTSALFLGPGGGSEIVDFRAAYPDSHLYLIEASDNFKSQLQRRFSNSTILHPSATGKITLPDNTVDVAFAFSVLHHIPNVSAVIYEMARVLKPTGVLVVREPCSSMGDWRFPRSATPNERGISAILIKQFAKAAGLQAHGKETPILLEPINRILKRLSITAIPFPFLYIADRILSLAVSWNDHYWRDTFFKKIGPSSYFYVFRK